MRICYLRVKATLRYAPALRGLDPEATDPRSLLGMAMRGRNGDDLQLPRHLRDDPEKKSWDFFRLAWKRSRSGWFAPGHPAPEGEPDVGDMGSRFVVVVPAKCFYFFKDIDGWEVIEELADEGTVDIVIEGVARQAVFEVAEDLLAVADAVS
jgi:hypothetical protein